MISSTPTFPFPFLFLNRRLTFGDDLALTVFQLRQPHCKRHASHTYKPGTPSKKIQSLDTGLIGLTQMISGSIQTGSGMESRGKEARDPITGFYIHRKVQTRKNVQETHAVH
jgi:hypothetical protein